MKSRQRLSLTQTQRLSLTTGLQAAIGVLRMDAAGLTSYLEEQASDNPHLVVQPPPVDDWLPRWTDAFARRGGVSGMGGGDSGGAATDRVGEVSPSLIAHVLGAIAALPLTAAERAIATALAEGLEPTGWLGQSVEQVAQRTGAAVTAVEAVLTRLQGLEPVGIFARSLSECLRLQAVDAGVLDTTMACILDHLDLLAAGNHARLARMCHVPQSEIAARLRVIRGFDPKPGAQFAAAAAPVREPDLVVRLGPLGWDVALNRSALPTLHLRAPAARGGPPETRAVWTRARDVHRMVESRNATLLRVAREILQRQQATLDHGLGALLPMTMADVAGALDLHESTVSRVVAGSSVDTPRGTWWLRALFSRGMGAELSAAALRDRLARLVAAEDPARPLSDAALALALTEGGAEVARRTVAKYRAGLGIPAAGARRRRARA